MLVYQRVLQNSTLHLIYQPGTKISRQIIQTSNLEWFRHFAQQIPNDPKTTILGDEISLAFIESHLSKFRAPGKIALEKLAEAGG